MAESGAARRRGPAPIASFDHECSDESSPETKQFQLPEILEDSSSDSRERLAAGEGRARSQSTPGALQAPAAPRIDISRASSSSHPDSRDSSPDLATGGLGFREDGALDLRSSTEELAFLEAEPPAARRAPRRGSQGSEAALLAVSGRTSRLSSVGSQASAHSAYSRAGLSRLSVASDVSRSPSPHKMLLETSFCGPKPIETDPEICVAAVEEHLLEIAKRNAEPVVSPVLSSVPLVPVVVTAPVDARDRREVRTEATVERTTVRPASRPAQTVPAATNGEPANSCNLTNHDDEKKQKENKNRAKVEQRQARSRERRDPSESRTKSKSKDIIRIRLKPDHEYDDDDIDDEESEPLSSGNALKPVMPLTESGGRPSRPTELAGGAGAAPRRSARDSRTPSPSGVAVSRKSSFCSLFKSRETIASPDSPSDALRRKKSLNEGRSRSRSRDRSTTPTSGSKQRGSVLSLFRTTRRGGASPAPGSPPRASPPPGLPPPGLPPPAAHPSPSGHARPDRLKYYEDAKDGIIHIPLRTPPDAPHADRRPASAPQPRVSVPILTPVSTAGPTSVTSTFSSTVSDRKPSKPIQRTVLPDGSIIIPLHSPTEKTIEVALPSPPPVVEKPKEQIVEVVENTDTSSTRVEIVQVTSAASSTRVSSEETVASPAPVTSPAGTTPDSPADRRRRERLTFSTNVGSRDQVFCTQFSITKTPSAASEASVSPGEEGASSSSGSGSPRAVCAGEARGLVVQDSFEEELPLVPTTLPQERPRALPMRPVAERAAAPPPPPAPRPRPAARATPTQTVLPRPEGSAPAAEGEKLLIRLPRRARTASAGAPLPARSAPLAAPLPAPLTAPPVSPLPAPLAAPPQRTRTRTSSDGLECGTSQWVEFGGAERRRPARRIETLQLRTFAAPEDCRCDCHARDSSECGEHAADS